MSLMGTQARQSPSGRHKMTSCAFVYNKKDVVSRNWSMISIQLCVMTVSWLLTEEDEEEDAVDCGVLLRIAA